MKKQKLNLKSVIMNNMNRIEYLIMKKIDIIQLNKRVFLIHIDDLDLNLMVIQIQIARLMRLMVKLNDKRSLTCRNEN